MNIMLNRESYLDVLRNPFHSYWNDSKDSRGDMQAQEVFRQLEEYFAICYRDAALADKFRERLFMSALNTSNDGREGKSATGSLTLIYASQMLADILSDANATERWLMRASWKAAGFYRSEPSSLT